MILSFIVYQRGTDTDIVKGSISAGSQYYPNAIEMQCSIIENDS